MEIEEIPADAKPSQVHPRPSADDIHTRNIIAIAGVTKDLRERLTAFEQQHGADMQRIANLETEVQQLKVQLIMAAHQGSGATAS